MQREIKFKRFYFRNEDKTDLICSRIWGMKINNSEFTAPTNVSLSCSYIDCQFIGLEDKNGIEIYEGYIVNCNGNIGQIVYSLNDDAYQIAGFVFKTDGVEYRIDTDNFEVIGNIYENPELLTENK